MFGIGFTEMILILIVALLIFGPDKMPELGKTMGKAVREFKSAVNKIDRQVKEEVKEVKDAAGLDETLHELKNDVNAINQEMKSADKKLRDFDSEMKKFDKDLKDISKMNPLKMAEDKAKETIKKEVTETLNLTEKSAEKGIDSSTEETKTVNSEFTATDIKPVKIEL